MRLRFSHKVLLVTLLPLVVAQLGTLFGVMRVAEEDVRATARENLLIGANVTNHYLESRADERRQTVAVLASDYALKEVLAFSEEESVRSALGNHGQRLGANFAAFVWLEDIDPIVTRYSQADDIRRFVTRVEFADTGPPKVATIILESGAYQLFSAPVQAPTTIGYLLFGFRFGDEVVAQIESLTGLEVQVLKQANDGWVAISNDDGLKARGWIDPNRIAREVYEVQQERQAYLGVYTPLSDTDQNVVVALRKSLAEAMAPYSDARFSLLMFAFGILLLVGVVGLWFSRSIVKPVAHLSAAVEQVAQGSYSAELTVSGNDEFGRLADTFRHMQSAIAEREQEILHQSRHDDLSGLPNRHQLKETATTELSGAAHSILSFVAIRLGGMQAVTSSIGQAATDQLIVHLAQLIQVRMPAGAVLYQTGTYEFFLTIPELQKSTVVEFANKVAKQIGNGVLSGQQNIRLRSYWGISSFPDHGQDSTSLIRFAQVASTDAFSRNDIVEVYEADREKIFERQLKIVNDLPEALQAGDLSVVLQPKINLADGSIHGAEALVRWTHEELGFLSPEEFIPMAERSGTIVLLTRFVITQALKQLSELHSMGSRLRVAVNLSTRDLLDDGLADFVINVLEAYKLAPDNLTLEVTETSIMEHLDKAVSTLERLGDLGVTLAIDDFGTGQSSLAQLQKLPIDELKVDKGFVMPLASDATSDLLVSTTITLAHQMGLKVVAEGVEDEYSARRLAGFGCEIGQGYFFSKPLPFEEFVRWLSNYQPVPYAERRSGERPFTNSLGRAPAA